MTTILRGNILHTPAFGQLEAVPEGYLVLEEGTVEGVFDKLPERYAACPVTDYGCRRPRWGRLQQSHKT